MSIFSENLQLKELKVNKKVEIYNTLYEKLDYLSSEVYDASINKLINIAIENLISTEEIKPFEKASGDIASAHCLQFRLSLYKGLEELKDRYGISIYRLINLAIKNALDSEDKNKNVNLKD